MAVQVITQVQGRPINKGSSYAITEYMGLSEDIKPIDCERGSTFKEEDTGDMYEFNGTEWFLTKREIGEYDSSGRASFNGIFGEQYVALKKPKISANFNYTADTRRVIQTVANGGTVSRITNLMAVSSSSNVAGSASIQTKETVRYTAGRDCEIYGTLIFSEPKENSYQRGGLYNNEDGFFIGYNGLDFGVGVRKNGIDTFIKKEDFNGFSLDSFDFNPQMMNIYRIVFGYLGIAPAFFELYMGHELGWRVIHVYDVVNKQAETHIGNPYLPIRIEVGNTGNNTNMVVKSGSVYMGTIDGITSNPDSSSREFSASRSASTLPIATDGVITIFHNKSIFSGISNKIEALLLKVGAGAISGSNKPTTIKLYKLASVPTGTSFTNVDLANSILEYSNVGTINLIGAELLDAWAFSANSQINADVSNLNHLLLPDEYAVFTYTTTGTLDLEFTIRWSELF